MPRPPKSHTQLIQGDARLTTIIDPFSFLADEDFFDSDEEEIPESPDEGQCQ